MIDYIDTSQLPRDQNTTTVIFRNRKDIKFRADFLVSVIASYKHPYVGDFKISLGNIYHKFQGNTSFLGYGLPVLGSDEVSIDFDMPPASCIVTIRRSDYRDLLQVACRYPLRFAIGVRYWSCCEGRYQFTDVNDQCKVSFTNIFAMRKTTQRYRTLNLLEMKFVQLFNIFRTNRNDTMSADILQIMKTSTLPKIIAPLPECIKFGSNCVCVHDGEEQIADQWLNQLQNPNMPKKAPWESFHVKTQILASRADQIQKHIERVAAFRAVCKVSGGTSSFNCSGQIEALKKCEPADLPVLTSRNIAIIGKLMPSAEQYPEFRFAARKNSRALVKIAPNASIPKTIYNQPICAVANVSRQPARKLHILPNSTPKTCVKPGTMRQIQSSIQPWQDCRRYGNISGVNPCPAGHESWQIGSQRSPIQPQICNYPRRSGRGLVCLQKR